MSSPIGQRSKTINGQVRQQVAPKVALPLGAMRAVRALELRFLAALEAGVMRQRRAVQVGLAAARADEFPALPVTADGAEHGARAERVHRLHALVVV